MSQARGEPQSLLAFLDRCLGDRRRFWRMLLLMAMLAVAGLGLILVSGWTAGPATMLTLWVLTRHRRPS
jgi:hypothetical protein